MDSYCDINNAYIDKGILSSGDLEKRARQINNNKRSKSKDVYRQYRKTSNAPNNKTSNNKSQSHTFAQFLANKADKGTNINIPDGTSTGGFYTAQGDYLENGEYQQDNAYNPENTSGTRIQDIIDANKNLTADKQYKYRSKSKARSKSTNKKIYDDHTLDLDTPSSTDLSESLDSLSTDESNSTDSSNSSITWDIKDIDKQIKTKSKFDTKKRSKRHKCIDFDLNSVDSLESLDSGESLLRHIRFCTECKNKVIDLIRKNKINNKNKSNLNMNDKFDTNSKLLNEIRNLNLSHKIIEQMSKSSVDIDSTPLESTDTKQKVKSQKNDTHVVSKSTESYIPEIKEIITVCLIGFLIIMVLDLLMRSK